MDKSISNNAKNNMIEYSPRPIYKMCPFCGFENTRHLNSVCMYCIICDKSYKKNIYEKRKNTCCIIS